jgi:phenylalanyl-tRNA synthetase beta chain
VIEERMTDAAAAAGLYESMSAPFANRRTDEAPYAAWLAEVGSGSEPVTLSNPLDAGKPDLRSTLLPGLLDAAARNVHHGQREVALFEVGRVFDRPGDPNEPATFESRRFAFALAGDVRGHWSSSGSGVRGRADFFDARGLTEAVLSAWLDPRDLAWSPFQCDAFGSGAAALVRSASGETLAVVGLVSRAELEKRKLDEDVFAGELRVDAIPSAAAASAKFEPFSSFPPIAADLSFAHDRTTSWARIRETVLGANPADLESVRVVDRYDGPGAGEGRVKTTIRLLFRSPEKTLEQDHVNREVRRVGDELVSRLGVTFG